MIEIKHIAVRSRRDLAEFAFHPAVLVGLVFLSGIAGRIADLVIAGY